MVLADAAGGDGLPPNLLKLREGAVSFARHYTVSNDCTPSRSALLTGLYTHQTGCMITGGSTLDPGFPTWGSMLREHGYHTRWYGKWHLTHGDSHWNELTGPADARAVRLLRRHLPLARRRAGAGLAPGPAHRQGSSRSGSRRKATPNRGARRCRSSTRTTSPGGTSGATACRAEVERAARRAEAAAQLRDARRCCIERRKPRLQRSLQATAAASFGPVPFGGPELAARWLAFLDLYVKLQREVDHHVGQVLHALESHPAVAANTVVVFTSDHGEYGGSHGLRGKGAGVYEEGIRVPLIVKRPARRAHARPRTGAHAADLERRRGAAAAHDRHGLATTGAQSPATRTSPDART